VHIPVEARVRCDKCRASVVWCETAAKSRGIPVTVAVDIEPTTEGLALHEQVIISVTSGGKYFAGGFATRAKRDAAAAAGVQLHMPHKRTCRPPRSQWTKR